MFRQYQSTYKVFLVLLLGFFSICAMAQKNEIGGGLGIMYYTGDLARKLIISNVRPAGTVFLRHNVNDHISVRASFTGGKLVGNDNKPLDAFATARNASFNIFISEFAGSFEYYFLDFRSERAVVNWSPYFHGGVGIFGMLGQQNKNATYSDIQITVPLGAGFRYQMDKKWAFGVEFGARVTFFDYLDNISQGDIFNKNFQYGNKNDNDLYYFAGFTVSYTFYKVICPTIPLKQGYGRR